MSPVSVSACSNTAMHFLTGSAKWDFDSDVVSLGVLENPASDWSEAFAIVVREVVIVRGRVYPQPGLQTSSWAFALNWGQVVDMHLGKGSNEGRGRSVLNQPISPQIYLHNEAKFDLPIFK